MCETGKATGFTSVLEVPSIPTTPADPAITDWSVCRMPFGAADLNRCVGATIEMGKPQSLGARQVTLSPFEHRPHHRHEIDARFGKHILVAGALPGLAVGLPRQQSEVDQFG